VAKRNGGKEKKPNNRKYWKELDSHWLPNILWAKVVGVIVRIN